MKQLHATNKEDNSKTSLHSRVNESMCTLRINTKNLTCNKSGYSGENEYMKVLH